MPRFSISPSGINLFMECERCFWLKYNERVKRPNGPFPSLPSGMDKIIKEHFDAYRENGESPPVLAEADIDAGPFPDEDFLSSCRSWRSDPSYINEDRDAKLMGGVDDLLLTPDDEIVVLDYKTRGYPPKGDGLPEYYRRQVNLYNLILRSNGHVTADYGLLLYYYPNKVGENGDVVFHTEFVRVPIDIDAAKALFNDAIDTLESPYRLAAMTVISASGLAR